MISPAVFDSHTQQLQVAAPGANAKLYACGITPYDATHIGHANTYLAFDLLNRVWRAAAKQVTYTQNITDVDDPLLERATATNTDWRELAASQIELFAGDMAALNVLPPENWVPVTQAMLDIIAAVTALLQNGAAYRIEPDSVDIYFDISSDPAFGSVAGLPMAEMLALFAERGGDPQRPGKRNRLDPLLWRAQRPDEPWWAGGALGNGRPGWHIGCAVIARTTLGDHFDVLGGGRDLLFPHHEMSESICRVLASLGTAAGLAGNGQTSLARDGQASSGTHRHRPNAQLGARNFMHCGMVAYQGEKMSKSLGNLVIVSDLLAQGIDPMAIRLTLLAHHYRSDWEWTDEELAAGQARLAAWRQPKHRNIAVVPVIAGTAEHIEQTEQEHQIISQISAALADDLDAPKALEIIDSYLVTTAQPSIRVTQAIDQLLGVRI